MSICNQNYRLKEKNKSNNLKPTSLEDKNLKKLRKCKTLTYINTVTARDDINTDSKFYR
jgi:hypothetical protein